MIQTATDLLAPAQSKISVKPKDVSSRMGFAKALEAEGLRLEEQPAQPVVVMELPIEIEPDISRFPSSIFELIGTAETPEEEPEDVEENAAPELNVIAYIAYNTPASVDQNEDKPIAHERGKIENPELPLPQEDEPANADEPVVRETEAVERAEPVVIAAETKVVEPPKKTEKRTPVSKAEAPEKAEAPGKLDTPEKAQTPEKTQAPEKIETPEKAQTPAKIELEKPISREKPEPRRREEALEKMPPERKPAFTDFLTNIAEARNAQKPDGAQTPVPRAQPQFQLLNTGRAAFTESLESVVRFARAEGATRATLIVDPPALGRVSVEIITTAKGIEASLKVSSEQVRALVQDQIVQLKQTLAQIGVQTAEFSVDVQQQDKQNEQAWQNQNLKNRAHNADKEDEAQDDEEVFRVDLRKGLLHWVA